MIILKKNILCKDRIAAFEFQLYEHLEMCEIIYKCVNYKSQKSAMQCIYLSNENTIIKKVIIRNAKKNNFEK